MWLICHANWRVVSLNPPAGSTLRDMLSTTMRSFDSHHVSSRAEPARSKAKVGDKEVAVHVGFSGGFEFRRKVVFEVDKRLYGCDFGDCP